MSWMSPIAPSRIFWIRAWRAEECRAISPALIQKIQGLAGRGMPSHQPGADLEVLLLRGFARPQDAFDAARVGGEVLFHEYIDALLHGILQVGRAEGGTGGQPRPVARRQAI